MTVEDLTNGTTTNTNPSPVQSGGIRVMQNSSQNENELVDLYPRTITPTKDKHISSFDVSFISLFYDYLLLYCISLGSAGTIITILD